MPFGGHHGRYLRIDLTDGGSESVPLAEDVLRRYVGGVGLGTWLLSTESPPRSDPLGSEAALVVALSPFVGTPLTTSAKLAVVAASPLTGRLSDALAGDRFAIQLKACGVDALVLRGKAPAWSLLVIDDDEIRLESAEELVGHSAAEAERRVQERLGGDFAFFGIGPAGENLVRFAVISGNGRHAGRGGMGAVLGAKHLKGIAVRGTRRTPLAHRDEAIALAKDLAERSLGEGTAKYRELGTIANVLVFNRLGALPTRNFTAGTFEGAERISGEAFHAREDGMRRHCAACTIGCEHVFQTRKGREVRLEYEGLFALGSLCGVDDREMILEAAAACNRHGLDVISAGGTVAFAMECGERGLLDGAPAFGDGEGLLKLLSEIASRTGIGDLLAEGTRRASARIGDPAPSFACHVKGLEIPGYEPRAMQAMALGLAVGTRGADHNRAPAYAGDLRPGADRLRAEPSKAEGVVEAEDQAALLDSLVLCKFLRGVFTDLYEEAARLLTVITGWDVSPEELRDTARRIVTARKLFNQREGWTRSEDTLPDRFLTESLAHDEGTSASLTRAGLEDMITRYYEVRGWTAQGRVPPEQIEALALDGLV